MYSVKTSLMVGSSSKNNIFTMGRSPYLRFFQELIIADKTGIAQDLDKVYGKALQDELKKNILLNSYYNSYYHVRGQQKEAVCLSV
ncbi:hypothetical protein bsdcttw_00190 [Anaerocolumna chitinilytica]|uniref:Uncharacterized protein n=1 Tax=Anaerocolumna chitinilytica TaxID=1727145 RepID=A0A7I8DER0_9FIRM|nr:hypothetical protein bsdcttw_00190 [Anaerocolumna chitinilytica]